MDVRLRAIVDLMIDDVPEVRFDDHAEVGALVMPSRDNDGDMVQLAFDDHRHLRRWAAALVDAVDRRYGPPAPAKRADEEPADEPAGAEKFVYGKGE